MTVKELIEQLQKFDSNSDVTFMDRHESSENFYPIFKPYYLEEISYITNVIKDFENNCRHIPKGFEVSDFKKESVKNIVVLFDR